MAKSVENAILAFVCWMSIDRSAGKFRIALIRGRPSIAGRSIELVGFNFVRAGVSHPDVDKLSVR